MKKALRISFVGMLVTLFITSCTVERRMHNSGFHVKWNKSYSSTESESAMIEKVENESLGAKLEVKSQSSLLEDKIENNTNFSTVKNEESGFLNVSKTEQTKVISISNNVERNNAKQSKKVKELKSVFKKEENKKSGMDDMEILLLILCFLIPFLAVGLATDWDVKKVVICLILSFLFWVPGIIYALLVVLNKI